MGEAVSGLPRRARRVFRKDRVTPGAECPADGALSLNISRLLKEAEWPRSITRECPNTLEGMKRQTGNPHAPRATNHLT